MPIGRSDRASLRPAARASARWRKVPRSRAVARRREARVEAPLSRPTGAHRGAHPGSYSSAEPERLALENRCIMHPIWRMISRKAHSIALTIACSPDGDGARVRMGAQPTVLCDQLPSVLDRRRVDQAVGGISGELGRPRRGASGLRPKLDRPCESTLRSLQSLSAGTWRLEANT